jgi:hypothetical protein
LVIVVRRIGGRKSHPKSLPGPGSLQRRIKVAAENGNMHGFFTNRRQRFHGCWQCGWIRKAAVTCHPRAYISRNFPRHGAVALVLATVWLSG